MSRGARAVVLGGGPTALGMLQSLHRARIPKTLVLPGPDPIRWSRTVGDVVTRSGEDLAEVLSRIPDRPVVLLPCTDRWLRAVALTRDRWGAGVYASIPSLEAAEILTDKARFARLLETVGIAHPRTKALTSPDDLEHVDLRAFSEVFLKPSDSQSFSEHYGVKAIRARSVEELAEVGHRLLGEGVRMILQELVPGPPTNHYFVDGFRQAGDRAPTALFARQRVRMHPADFGNSSYHRSISLDDVRPAVDGLSRLLRFLDYIGIFSAEFKLDPRDGEYKLLEVNPRAWWYIGFASRCGANIGLMAYDHAIGNPITVLSSYQVGVRCVYPRLDIRATVRDRGFPRGIVKFLRDWAGAMQPVMRLTDPLPALVDSLGVIARRANLRRGR